ncbi:hypothetical protein BS47DRAFT_1374009 [Hydnum rufescens UP504]|uniref:TauD/TfdA-like domain-containing protein n=1 Tax=Hydnum rufescens UP504 TaxID=1448309 RepID=A0A9P6AKE3_9AGAM|nr:hypothetical protein BS47DRAFT_1374009 [Hydnum rufescens UP504]
MSQPNGQSELLAGSPNPLKSSGSLDQYSKIDSTPTIGVEFGRGIQLSAWLKEPNSDALIRDLAILVSERGVAFFRDQDLTIDEQRLLGTSLGELTLKPQSTSELGSEISIITSERKGEYTYGDRSQFASNEWHSDITFEPIPSDYSILKIHTIPTINGCVTGGDTLWASGYEVYDRLSPSFAAYSKVFQTMAKALGIELRSGIRGSPHNFGDALEAVHPVIRVNPVTGWKSVFVNRSFTRRILGVTKDESDKILEYLYALVDQNHNLQVRFKWEKNSLGHLGQPEQFPCCNVRWDYESERRVGNRVVSLGEKPYFSPNGVSRRAALGLSHSYGWVGEGPK